MSSKYFKFSKQFSPKIREKVDFFDGKTSIKIIGGDLSDGVLNFLVGKNIIVKLNLDGEDKVIIHENELVVEFMFYGKVEGSKIEEFEYIDLKKLKDSNILDFYIGDNTYEFTLNDLEEKGVLLEENHDKLRSIR